MVKYSELYPCSNERRMCISLDGMWNFQFDPQGIGEREGWTGGLPDPMLMPVPASFADLFTDAKCRDYCGDFWYETAFYLPDEAGARDYWIRFGSITHRAVIYCNGVEVGRHEGGFLPVMVPLRGVVRRGMANRLVVKVNNELSERTIPCGSVITLRDGRKLAKPYFDFFNYSGIHRDVNLLSVPEEAVQDYSVSYELDGDDALVHYSVRTNGCHPVKVALYDRKGNLVLEDTPAQSGAPCTPEDAPIECGAPHMPEDTPIESCAPCTPENTPIQSGAPCTPEEKTQSAGCFEGTLVVRNAHLWQVRQAYLYTLVITIVDGDQVIDKYSDQIGIRTVSVEGSKILLNGQPVYLKGFGRHEDFEVIGRGLNRGVVKRDFECMKWTGANCFRTSHYPYDEEWYRLADAEGFLIIDEVPAVGMMRSTQNFLVDPEEETTYFFASPTVPELKAVHMAQIEEMFARDKNHPSVIAWSLFNEPETTDSYARAYFTDIFQFARGLDPQKRPLTGALLASSLPQTCQCYDLCDFICLNRYYGWYVRGGAEIEEAMDMFAQEMDGWAAKDVVRPIVFTEFGADTLGSGHKLPGVMWSQEYQCEFLRHYFDVFDRYDFVQGEMVWNFADFQTADGIMRADGNKKGVFTRNRQPKDAAYLLKQRWENL